MSFYKPLILFLISGVQEEEEEEEAWMEEEAAE